MIDVVVPGNALFDDIGAVPETMRLVRVGPEVVPAAAEVVVFGAELRHLLPVLGDIEGLRLIQTLNAGVEWLLPLVPRGVTLCNASGVHDGPVAEWVVATVVAMERRLLRFVAAQGERRWDTSGNALTTEPDEIEADDLDGKRVLIVGHGSIGRAVEARLAPFGASVVGVASHARDGVLGPESQPALLPQADVVVLLAPLTDATRGLAGREFLAAMRDGALLVNAARGAMVDHEALEAELRSGRLRAVLDVTEPEPLPAEHSLWTAPNLFITPHVAGTSKRWKRRAYSFVGDQLRRYGAGEPLRNVRTDY
jgi:phosphoglycerate dehydrogenase-like enzyme